MKKSAFFFFSILAFTTFLFNLSVSLAQDDLPYDLESRGKGSQSTITSANNSYGVINGTVLDKKSQKPLQGVNVIVEGIRRGAVTNHNGEFTISKLIAGEYTLVFRHIGYALYSEKDIEITAGKTVTLKTIQLEEQAIPLREIVVTPGSYTIMGSEPSPRQTLTSDDIKMMGWAEDITRAVQRIPGITSNDFQAKFNVRGGEGDEVLVLLDGMQVYKPFHQKDFGGGLFSTVDIEAIESVDLLTGGFTADYGDRMSGVLNMKTKTPKEDQRQTSLGFSLMNMRLFSMGAFHDNKGEWLFSARRGYLDIINKLMKNEFKLQPKYYDVLGKMEYKLNNIHSLAAYGFLASDQYRLDEKVLEKGMTEPNIDYSDTKYKNNYAWLTWNSIFSSKLYARSILYTGLLTQKRYGNNYDNDPKAHLVAATISDDRDMQIFGIKQDWTYQLSQKVLFKYGMDIKKLKAKYNYSNNINNEYVLANDSLSAYNHSHKTDISTSGNQAGLYLSTRFQVLTPLTVETGIRYDYSSYSNDELWSPRLNLVYALGRATFLRLGWGHFYQSQTIDELNVQYEDNSYYPAELAEHFVLGFEHRFNNGLQFRAEGYLKQITNTPPVYYSFANIDEFYPEARTDLIKLIVNEAKTKGIEFYLKYDTGKKYSWWFSYVLSEAQDDVSDIVYAGRLVKQTGWLPRAWDQRHTINLDLNYRPNVKWHFNFSWNYRTGWPTTDFVVASKQREDGSLAYYHDHGLFNGTRFPSYHRMDVRVNRHFYTSKGKVTTFLHIINLYNHDNVYSYDHEVYDFHTDHPRIAIEAETYFPIMPFLGVSWEF